MGKGFDEVLKALDGLSVKELEDLAGKLAPMIELRREEDKKRLISEMERMARESGFDSVGALLGTEGKGGKKQRKPRAPSEVSYVNPLDPAQVWSGRGRKPAWVKKALEAGQSLQGMKAGK